MISSFEQAKQSLEATIFMVTHDSFSASFCDRVIVMKDGRVFREISRTGDRRAFMEQLLGVLSAMNGGDPNDPQ